MKYRELTWGKLKSYAKEQGINTKGMIKVDIIKALDSKGEHKPFIGLSMLEPKEDTNPFLIDIQPYYSLISQWKRTLTLPSNVSGGLLNDLREIHRKYIGNVCNSCKISPVMNALVGYYERAGGRGL